VPVFIRVLLIINLALGLAYVLDYLIGRPYRPLTQFLDLNGEWASRARHSDIPRPMLSPACDSATRCERGR
jgi:hypothetical protein